VSHLFWKGWRKHVKSINPDAYIVGEIWDDASKWLAGDEFDAVMNYPFARAVVRFFIDTDGRRLKPSGFDRELATIRKDYPGEISYVLQNLIDSHDTDRLASMIMNPNRKYDDQNGLRNNPNYDVGKPTASARRLQKLILLFQMTYVGAPMIYYGDEGGMWGADDPDDRKPMVWQDLTYQNERSHPVPGKTRTDDEVKFDKDLFDYYKLLVRIRKDNLALRRGGFTTMLIDDENDVYAFGRSAMNNELIVVLNRSHRTATVHINLPGSWVFREQLTGGEIKGSGRLQLAVPPLTGSILLRVQ
jgi:glycosidase